MRHPRRQSVAGRQANSDRESRAGKYGLAAQKHDREEDDEAEKLGHTICV